MCPRISTDIWREEQSHVGHGPGHISHSAVSCSIPFLPQRAHINNSLASRVCCLLSAPPHLDCNFFSVDTSFVREGLPCDAYRLCSSLVRSKTTIGLKRSSVLETLDSLLKFCDRTKIPYFLSLAAELARIVHKQLTNSRRLLVILDTWWC